MLALTYIPILVLTACRLHNYDENQESGGACFPIGVIRVKISLAASYIAIATDYWTFEIISIGLWCNHSSRIVRINVLIVQS